MKYKYIVWVYSGKLEFIQSKILLMPLRSNVYGMEY